MTGDRFEADVLALLEREVEVAVETTGADGERRSGVIWVVVDDGEVYVRSLRGERGRWFKAAMDRPDEVTLVAGSRRIPVRPTLATDDRSIARCSTALERKYAGHPSTPSMVRREILGTTLRLEPRAE